MLSVVSGRNWILVLTFCSLALSSCRSLLVVDTCWRGKQRGDRNLRKLDLASPDFRYEPCNKQCLGKSPNRMMLHSMYLTIHRRAHDFVA